MTEAARHCRKGMGLTAEDVLRRDLAGLDWLARVHTYLRHQFRLTMPPDEAQAHFDARALVWRLQNKIMRRNGMEITKAEIDAACSKGRAHG